MDLHQKYISRCTRVARSDKLEGLSAVMVGGSVGRGDYDALSDIDFFLLVEKEHLAGFLDSGAKRLASLLGTPLLFHGPRRAWKLAYGFSAFFADHLLCSFYVTSTDTLSPTVWSKTPGLILYDPDGRYAEMEESSKSVEYDPKSVLFPSCNLFWLRALKIREALDRGDLWSALSQMSALRDQMVILMRLVEGSLPKGMNFYRAGKDVEKDLSDEFLDSLSQTLCDYSRESIKRALLFSVNWHFETYTDLLRERGWADRDHIRDLLAVREVVENGLVRH